MIINDPHEFAAAVLPAYNLPTPTTAEFVSGGLLHRLIRVETLSSELSASSLYALKVLSPRSTEQTESRSQLERAESVALQAFNAGIAASVAIAGPDGHFLQNVNEQWVILYPWIEGKTLPPTAAPADKCGLMGEYLAQLHALEIRFPDQSKPVPEAYESGHFHRICERAQLQNASWAPRIAEVLEELEVINGRAMQSQLMLQDGWVTGHLDCDQKNVLWQGDSPIILDWESAKPIHPALEAMGAGLSWAGQSAGQTDFDSFAAFFQGYLSVYPLTNESLELAVEAVLGKWIIWLEFNLQRLLDPQIHGTHEAVIAHHAGMHALGATLKLSTDGPLYKEWLQQMRDIPEGNTLKNA